MTELHYSIHINAPRNKVWSTLLEDATYRQWSAVFMPGSYYQGDWSEGSKMLFLGPSEDGTSEGGMSSIVKENRPEEYMSLQYHAEIHDGVEVPMASIGFENYTLEEKDGGTELRIELMELPDEYAGMFEDTWPAALKKVKELAEN